MYFIFFRTHDESYSRGALSDAQYANGKKRSIISLKMCFIGCLLEALGGIFVLLFTYLHSLGLHNLHYPDCFIMNVIIPFVYLMNDEDTKGIILEESWYQGVKHMLGLYKEPQETTPASSQRNQNANLCVQRNPP